MESVSDSISLYKSPSSANKRVFDVVTLGISLCEGKEKEWSEYSTLWNSWENICFVMTGFSLAGPVVVHWLGKPWSSLVCCFSLNSIQACAGASIDSFQKIQKDDIHLAFSSVQPSDYTMESCDELGLVASTFPESMLVVTEDAIGFKVAHGATVHDMF